VCSIEELNRAKSQAALVRLCFVLFDLATPILWGRGSSKYGARERKRARASAGAHWFSHSGHTISVIVCTAALHFRISYAVRTREGENTTLSPRMCVRVCWANHNGSLVWIFVHCGCLCSAIYRSLCVLCSQYYVCVWKDFLVCEKDMETRFPFSCPALHSRILSFRSPFFSILFRSLFATSSWPLQKGYYCNYLLIWP